MLGGDDGNSEDDELEEKPNLRSSVIIKKKKSKKEKRSSVIINKLDNPSIEDKRSQSLAYSYGSDSEKVLKRSECPIPNPGDPIEDAVKKWRKYIQCCTTEFELRDVVLSFSEEELNVPLLETINEILKQRGKEILIEEKEKKFHQTHSDEESELYDIGVITDSDDESAEEFDEVPNLDELIQQAKKNLSSILKRK